MQFFFLFWRARGSAGGSGKREDIHVQWLSHLMYCKVCSKSRSMQEYNTLNLYAFERTWQRTCVRAHPGMGGGHTLNFHS